LELKWQSHCELAINVAICANAGRGKHPARKEVSE
jgi:hypothetical protein